MQLYCLVLSFKIKTIRKVLETFNNKLRQNTFTQKSIIYCTVKVGPFRIAKSRAGGGGELHLK